MEIDNLPVAGLLISLALYLVLPGRWRRIRWLNYFVGFTVFGSIAVYALVGGDTERFNYYLPYILAAGVGAAVSTLLIFGDSQSK